VETEVRSIPELGRWCPACQTWVQRFDKGPNGRPDAACPSCRALERHRFLAIVLDGLSPLVATSRLVVDVAPSEQITAILRRISSGRSVRIDFDPAADNRAVDVQASLTALPFADGSIDLLVCYHVLEHIPDDLSAMSEIGRTLSAGGFALVQVPWRRERATDEDPEASEEERIRRFGRADHVRMYGADFEDRLTKAGLASHRLVPRELLDDRLIDLFRLVPDETVWLLRRDNGNRVDVNNDAVQLRNFTALTDALSATDAQAAAAADARAARAEALAAKWEREYHRLRDKFGVRLMALLARPFRRRRGGSH
jgi:SAM-dependent methyltransferase